MNPDVFSSALRAFNRRVPFQHFFIELMSGDRIQVRHPESVRAYGEAYHFIAPDQSQRVFDATAVAQLLDELGN